MTSLTTTSATPVSVTPRDPNLNFQLLRIYSYYRTLLSSILLLMFYAGIAPNIIATQNPTLFENTALIYTVGNIVTLMLLWWSKFSPKPERLFTIIFVDVVALVLLTHASGGQGSGLGFLLLVCVATGGIFLGTQLSTVIASVTTLLVLSQTLYSIQNGIGDSRTLFSAGSLGIMLFITALAFNYLSQKLLQSNREAANQAEHAAQLERITKLIVERMQTGVVVNSSNNTIELINESAKRLLNWQGNKDQRRLEDIPELEERISFWRAHPQIKTPNIKNSDNTELRINFTELDPKNSKETLIFVEDNQALTQEAQHLKLASLGRLTASIAHEIRNPLGAISHAGQLLAESPTINEADKRLTQIVATHSKRINQIIENVLQLSRRQAPQPELLDINIWLQQFADDYSNNSSDTMDIELHFHKDVLKSHVDTSQIRQVLTNLIDNGLRYGHKLTEINHITIATNINPITDLPFIDIIDDGDGISDDNISHIFEPFYTTEAAGSGLGLYLSKELCEANHAKLEYLHQNNKSCFRITLSHPERIH
jgi:two-component system sensor histidine kinase PilS (NtrC family)